VARGGASSSYRDRPPTVKRHRGRSETPEPLADSSARFPHLPRKTPPASQKNACPPGAESTIVRIADLGEQCGRSSEALPIAVTPGRASGDEELALNAGTAISEFAKSVTAITGSG
jgi:hypothetical protein